MNRFSGLKISCWFENKASLCSEDIPGMKGILTNEHLQLFVFVPRAPYLNIKD